MPLLEKIATEFERLVNEETTNEAIQGALIDTNHKTREMILRLRSYNADLANTFEKEYDALLQRAEDACNKGGDSTVLRKYLRSHAKGFRSVNEELAGRWKKQAEKVLGEYNQKVKAYAEQTNEPQEKDGRSSCAKAGDRKRGTPETTEPKVEPIRDQVFICYSHKDKHWLDELQIHLKPYVRNGSITAWSDEQIPPGTEWFEQIKRVLASTKVAILLLTKDFLASEFIHEHELRPLLKEAEKGDVRIIWIPVRACSYKETPLKDYQAAIDPEKPLSNMKKANRDKTWVRICKKIKKAVVR